MRKFVILAPAFLMLACTVAKAGGFSTSGYTFYKKLVVLSDSSNSACTRILGNLVINAKFITPRLGQGYGYAQISNPTNGIAPITALLSQDGLSDRYAFSRYYSPGKSIQVNNKRVLLKGVILNVCHDKTAQAGLMFEIAGRNMSNETCLVTTQTWNYCR